MIEPAPTPGGIDFSNWSYNTLPERTGNVSWQPDLQDLIYTAINHVEGDYEDADENCAEQVIERLVLAIKAMAAEKDAAVERAQRNSDSLREGLKQPDGQRLFPVWMERSMGASFAWLVWAVKPGAVRLIAICSTEAAADRYAANLPPGLSDFRAWKERAPLDHSFGFADSMHARVQGKL